MQRTGKNKSDSFSLSAHEMRDKRIELHQKRKEKRSIEMVRNREEEHEDMPK